MGEVSPQSEREMADHRARVLTREGRWRLIGSVALALGALLLVVNGVYFGYAAYARNQVGDISVQLPEPQATAVAPQALSVSGQATPMADQGRGAGAIVPMMLPAYEDADALERAPEQFPKPEGFRPVTPEDLLVHRTLPPSHLSIPALELESDVRGLRILDLGDARTYETPDNVVGHIPESANPGGRGNVWLFGHLESPIRGEGSIFRRLPEVYDLLTEGHDVYVVVDTGDGGFLYMVESFRKIHGDDLELYKAEDHVVTLVTCWPRFVYDERILVTAELVGIAEDGPAA